MSEELKAKVFISCGQSAKEERKIAKDLKSRLEALGYEAYVATQQQSLKDLRRNIFDELLSSEYFVFIDFKREKLVGKKLCRGSLFSHQELALASFREMPVLAFREKGVRKTDGIMKFIQANAKQFSDKAGLVDRMLREIERRKDEWRPDWKNQLRINKSHKAPERSPKEGEPFYRYYHIRIDNKNIFENARNCYGYIERIRDLKNNKDVRHESFELKWRGYDFPNATILSGSYRLMDAFNIFSPKPSIANINDFSKSSHIIPWIKGPGEFLLTYMIISDNFDRATAKFRLKLAENMDDIVFEKVG